MFIPIPVGRRFTVTLRQPVEATYTCTACHFESPVVVKAVAHGSGTSALFLDDEGATESAYELAAEALATAVRSSLGLVACPKCGAAGPATAEAARSEMWQSAILAGVASLVSFTIGVVIAAAVDYVLVQVIAGVATIALARLVFGAARNYSTRRRLREARDAVVFGANLGAEGFASSLLDLPPEPEPVFTPEAPIDDPVACPSCGMQTSASAEFCRHCLTKTS